MNREQLTKKINDKYGERALFKMAERITDVEVLSTGSLSLDLATGVGGFPRGRIVEIYGPEQTGKSMLLLSAMAQTQEQGGYCAFIDVEHALTPSFAQLLGVDTKKLYYSQPDSGNQALSLMEDLINSGMFDIVGLDSVAALVTEDELESEYTQQHIAPTAKLMAQALKRMTASISKTRTVAVFINQIREKPMVMFGKSQYTTGGRALKFYSSLRIEVTKIATHRDESKKQTGHVVRCTLQKNKVAPPFSTSEIELDYKKGVNRLHDLLLVAKQLDVIKQESSWFKYRNLSWPGIEKTKAALIKDGKLLEEIHAETQKKIAETS